MEDIDDMRSLVFTILLCCFGVMTALSAPAFGGEPVSLAVSPDILHVDTFFSGGKVTIDGEIPDGDEVLIEIMGPKVDELFNIKGRVGPFWMTREKVHLNDAPRLYRLLLPKGENWLKQAAELGLGVDELKKRIHISGSAMSTDEIFNLFVRLKDSEHLYGETLEAISYSPGPNQRRHFSAEYRFPASTAAGLFTIKATSVSNGARGPEFSHDVRVDEIGFVKLVNDLASNQRLVYGVGSVLIALFAGAVMGFIFKGGGGH